MRLIVVCLVAASLALAGCGDSPPEDGDGDGIPDRQEIAGWDITVDSMTARSQRHVTSNPNADDSDGDGLSDTYEYALGGDPMAADTDGDGLSDCQEARHRLRSECERPDFDATDGGYRTRLDLADSDPGQSRYNNAAAFDDPTGTLVLPRVWGDGLADGAEVHGYEVDTATGPRRVVTDPLKRDSDSDGLEDGEEALLYTSDPTVNDSDGDGCDDGRDAWPDRRHTLEVGLLELTLNDTQDVRLHGLLQDAPWSVATRAGPSGTDLSGAQDRVTPTSCSAPAYDPWVRLEILAAGEDGLLDLHATNPDHAFVVFWNVREGTLAWEPGGAALPSGVQTWMGRDGTLTFQPHLGTQGT